MAGVASRTRARLARYWCRSPSGGRITTVEPCMTWSPVSRSACSSTSQHRWSEAWPGVCSARRVRCSPAPAPGQDRIHPSPTSSSGAKPSAGAVAHDPGPRGLGQRRRTGCVVDVGVGDEDGGDRAQRGRGGHDGGRVGLVGGPGVDHHRVGPTDEVRVGARPGHETRVRGGEPQDARCHLVDTARLGGGAEPKSGTAGIMARRVGRRGGARARRRDLPRWPAWRPRARPR